ncbi:MAG: DUF6075 family protein [Anaerocolumna sp.]
MGQLTFSTSIHKIQFHKLLEEDNTYPSDTERFALFYIIAGNSDLYRKRSYIYDFKTHGIKQCLQNEGVDFSSGMKSLIRLGFNLYNGYEDNSSSPASLFYNLDEDNRIIAMNAISIRFIL